MISTLDLGVSLFRISCKRGKKIKEKGEADTNIALCCSGEDNPRMKGLFSQDGACAQVSASRVCFMCETIAVKKRDVCSLSIYTPLRPLLAL